MVGFLNQESFSRYIISKEFFYENQTKVVA